VLDDGCGLKQEPALVIKAKHSAFQFIFAHLMRCLCMHPSILQAWVRSHRLH
jgi:hypothetical protein